MYVCVCVGGGGLKQFNIRQHITKCEKNEGVEIHLQGTVFTVIH